MEQSKMHINNKITNKLTVFLVSWIDSYEAITLFFLKHIDQTNGNLFYISISKVTHHLFTYSYPNQNEIK